MTDENVDRSLIPQVVVGGPESPIPAMQLPFLPTGAILSLENRTKDRIAIVGGRFGQTVLESGDKAVCESLAGGLAWTVKVSR